MNYVIKNIRKTIGEIYFLQDINELKELFTSNIVFVGKCKTTNKVIDKVKLSLDSKNLVINEVDGLVNINTSDSIYLPTDFDDMLYLCNYANYIGDVSFPDKIKIVIVSSLLQELDFSCYSLRFSKIFQMALVEGPKVYVNVLSNLYEILEQDPSVLSCLLEETYLSSIKLCQKCKEQDILLPFSYAEYFINAFHHAYHDKLSEYDSISLGILTCCCISMQKGFLEKDEYYEIRDMFVPFGLSISYSNVAPNDILNFLSLNGDESLEIVALHKIGKFEKITVNKNEIQAALEELYYNENECE